jgi:hypothetical protein
MVVTGVAAFGADAIKPASGLENDFGAGAATGAAGAAAAKAGLDGFGGEAGAVRMPSRQPSKPFHYLAARRTT